MKLFSLANCLTLGNLFCGLLAIDFGFHEDYEMALYSLILSCVFDFFDGFAARWQKAESNIGKDLDSLADIVSFGVAPAFILFTLLKLQNQHCEYVAFVLPLFSALRLAKFNNDAEQTSYFKGLPTPINGLFLASMVYLQEKMQWRFLEHSYVWVGLILTVSFIMISNIKLMAIKFKGSKNYQRWSLALVVMCTLLALVFQSVAIPFIFVLYFIVSLIYFKLYSHEI